MNAEMWQEFNTFLQYLHSKHSKKAEKHSADFIQLGILTSQILLTNPIGFGIYPCIELKQSPIHGVGVFATQDLKVGMIATFYACDIAEFCPNKDRSFNSTRTSYQRYSPRMEEFISKQTPDDVKKIGNTIRDYSFDISEHVTIYAHPIFRSDTCYLGQFINDRFKPDFKQINEANYNALSKKKANCAYISSNFSVAIFITSPILKHEELFATYGYKFWQTTETNDSKHEVDDNV